MSRPKIQDKFTEIKDRFKRWRLRNPGYVKEYYHKNRDRAIARTVEWQNNHPEQVRHWRKKSHFKRMKSNPNYRISQSMRARIWGALRGEKTSSTDALVGGVQNLRDHIERLLPANWNWKNYGVIWEIDHIRPLCSFDLTNTRQCLSAFHYTNTQPLSVEDNRRKSKKWSKIP